MRPARPSLAPLFALLFVALAVAGCLQQGDDDVQHEATWTDSSHFGVRINEVQLQDTVVPGTEQTWRVEAENVGAAGENPVEYNAACEGPFEVTVQGPDGEAVQAGEPMADCEARDMQVLEGTQTLEHSWTWDGRLWADGAATTPEAGVYTIRFTFVGFHDGNPEHRTEAWGETTVHVQGS